MALTSINAGLLADVHTCSPHELRYESFDGTAIQGWVMPPHSGPPADGTKVPTGTKTPFLSHLYAKTMILPRQARDKHRENSK
jgi:hypothetical protein